MADDIDRAQEREQADRDLAIAAHLQRVAGAFLPRDPKVEATCIDCEEPIEPARLAAIRTSRCSECARAFERRTARAPT